MPDRAVPVALVTGAAAGIAGTAGMAVEAVRLFTVELQHYEKLEGVPLTFDGKAMTARPGDTLAAALLANGVRLVARSFKYHRPRGIMAAGVEEPASSARRV
mgnify:CR=1 FL=1